MITTNDICKSVAAVIPKLQVSCMRCMGGGGINKNKCLKCHDIGWTPTHNLKDIIMNIEYPLTIVLTNDMIGWCAEIALDGDTTTGMDRKAYDDPVYAVYEALFEALTDKLGAGKMGELESQIKPVKLPRRTRGRGRPIKSVRTVQESVKWLQPGSES